MAERQDVGLDIVVVEWMQFEKSPYDGKGDGFFGWDALALIAK